MILIIAVIDLTFENFTKSYNHEKLCWVPSQGLGGPHEERGFEAQ